MKEIIKMVVMHFFIITVGVLFCTSVSNLLVVADYSYPPEYPWTVMLTGVVGAIPTFLFYFKKEPTKKQFYLRAVIHFIIMSTAVMCLGAWLKWYDNFIEALIIFGMIFAVYVFVWFFSYLSNYSVADKINSALEEINDNDSTL